MNEAITCHNGAPFAGLTTDGKVLWQENTHGNHPDPYRHCSYCGSLHFEDIRKIVEEGGKLGGSDWKYGYPHKFYIYPKDGSMHKFYTEHLQDLADEEFPEFTRLLLTHTGIEFRKDEEGQVLYRAPYHGYQR